MSKRFAKFLCLALALILAGCLAGCGGTGKTAPPSAGNQNSAPSAGGDAVKLILGHAASPDQAPSTAVDRLAATVKEKTNGKVIIEVYPNSALGEEEELVESCMMGTVDMIFVSGASLSGHIPEYLTTDLPFPFGTPEEAYAYYDGEMGQALFEKAKGVGLIGITYLENGFRNMTNIKKPIHTPDDMKGLKMRTMNSPVYMAMMNALGAAPTPIPYGELYTALQQKTVDGQENPVANIDSMKFYEVQNYITLTRHTYDPNIMMMSEKTRAKLTDEQFDIILAAAKIASKESRDETNASEEEMIKGFESAGMTVTSLTDAERQLFADATKNVYQEFESTIGADFMAKYLAAIGR